MMTTMDANLDILNLVHKLAAHSWKSTPSLGNEHSPFSTTSATMQLSGNTNTINKITISRTPGPKENANSIQARRIQPVSAPIKPPDIQNLTLFPPIGETSIVSPGRMQSPLNNNKSNLFGTATKSTENANMFINTTPTARKLKQLESKLRGNVESSESLSFNKQKQKKSLPNLRSCHENSPKISKELLKKVPRSADLFSELTPEVVLQVDSIAEQYSALIDSNLCRNVLEELTYLFQLIATSRSNSCDFSTEKFTQLTSVAQQVYFVIKVLSLQLDKSLFSIDPRVIQLLVEKYPHRIPKLIRKHFQNWAEIQNKTKFNINLFAKNSTLLKPSEYHQCVTFRSETDGRSNFPNQGDFHAFCKQRDLFYSIKNLWTEKEETNISVGTSLHLNCIPTSRNKRSNSTNVERSELDPLNSKIKFLFNLNSSWANLSHFASLFTSQFIMDSLEAELKQSEDTVEDDQMRILRLSNPDRFAKLHDRISSGSELNTSPKDYLAFQKYFLKTAGSPSFNQHLIDRIVYEILQIEKSLENVGSFQPEETEVLMKKCILLSKLLGYLIFLPYCDDGPSNYRQIGATLDKETLLNKQLELRMYQRPPIDLTSTLVFAIRHKRLTFTLPWVIEFLSSADNVSLQLPAYVETITLISSIYHSMLKIDSKHHFPICLSNKNFLRFWCGNLFGLDKLPVSLVYLKEDERVLLDIVKKGTDKPPFLEPIEDESPLDLLDGFGNKLVGFYFSSKFAQMMFTLHIGLQQQEINSSTSDDVEVRHIVPIPARSPMKSKPLPDYINLQHQLESSFFDSNPPSIKKTVDFITDRIASNYVKKLRKIVPDQRIQLAQQRIFEENAAFICRKKMFEEMEAFSKIKCIEAVTILIGDSISSAALQICQQIATRKCFEKVVEWVDNHIKEEMFPEVPIPTLPVLSSKTDVPIANDTSITESCSEEVQLTFNTMILLHRCQKKLHQKQFVTAEWIDEILDSKSLGDCPGLTNTVVDFGLGLVTFVPTILTTTRIEKLISLWKKHWNNSECRILSLRNLRMLQESNPETEQESWRKLSEIVSRLVQKNILSLEIVEQDCFRILREDLPVTISSNVSRFLRNVTSSTSGRAASKDEDQSREVIDWIAWYCSDHQDEEF